MQQLYLSPRWKGRRPAVGVSVHFFRLASSFRVALGGHGLELDPLRCRPLGRGDAAICADQLMAARLSESRTVIALLFLLIVITYFMLRSHNCSGCRPSSGADLQFLSSAPQEQLRDSGLDYRL